MLTRNVDSGSYLLEPNTITTPDTQIRITQASSGVIASLLKVRGLRGFPVSVRGPLPALQGSEVQARVMYAVWNGASMRFTRISN